MRPKILNCCGNNFVHISLQTGGTYKTGYIMLIRLYYVHILHTRVHNSLTLLCAKCLLANIINEYLERASELMMTTMANKPLSAFICVH